MAVVAGFILSACGNAIEPPEVVMDKAKEAVVEVKSGDLQVHATVDGSSETDDLQFVGDLELAFDKTDEENQKLDLHADLSGKVQAGEKTLDGDVDFELRTLNKEYYVRLNQLDTSDESLTDIQPFLDLYMTKWLRINEDFIPQNIRELQGQDEAFELKRQQLENLFLETELFTVVKEYGVEKLSGRNVYHYGLAANIDGFKDYVTKAAIIDGRELTTAEVDEAVQVLSYIKNAEIYIDTKTYQVLKAVFQFSGEAVEQDASLVVDLTVEGTDYNKSIDVEAPEDAEDFNPLNLIMGLGGVPTAEEPSTTMEVPAEEGDTDVVEMEVVDEGGETSDEEVTE